MSQSIFITPTIGGPTTPTVPGGSSGDIQYNDGVGFGGFGDWNGSTLTVPGSFHPTAQTVFASANEWNPDMRAVIGLFGTIAPATADDGEYTGGLVNSWSFAPTGAVTSTEMTASTSWSLVPAANSQDWGYLYGADISAVTAGDGDGYELAGVWVTGTVTSDSAANLSFGAAIQGTFSHSGSGTIDDGYALYGAIQGSGVFTRASGLFIERMDNTLTNAVAKYAIFYAGGGGAGTFNVDSAGIVKAAGYKASDGSAGINTTVTTASLVGKTITFKDGLVTSFA